MCLTGLACAYYGIFAGGMIAFASIWFAITRQRWKDPKYWSLVAVAAVVCIGTDRAVLPALHADAGSRPGSSASLSGQYSANLGAWLISSAWAHRWWAPYLRAPSEVLFPGILAIVLGMLGRDVRRQRRGDGDRTSEARRGAGIYIGLAVFTFWLTFGPKAGLYTLLYYTVPVFSFLRAPSRAGIVVTLCLVVLAAPALIALMRKRSANAVFAILFVLAVADLYRAPLRMREAPPLPHAYRTLADLPKAPTIELPYWATSIEFHRHAEYMLASTAHWQPLINGYSDHIPQDFRDAAPTLNSFPSREVIRDSRTARRALRRSFHLDLMNADESRGHLIRRLDVEYAHYLRPLEKRRRRVALRNHRLAALVFFAAMAVLHSWPLASDPVHLSRLDNHDAELNTWIVAWVAHILPREPLSLFEAPILYPEQHSLAFSEHMFVPSVMGAPLLWLGASPVLVYNLLIIAGLALSGWAMYLLMARWTGSVVGRDHRRTAVCVQRARADALRAPAGAACRVLSR